MWLGRGGTVKLGKEANKQALKKNNKKKTTKKTTPKQTPPKKSGVDVNQKKVVK